MSHLNTAYKLGAAQAHRDFQAEVEKIGLASGPIPPQGTGQIIKQGPMPVPQPRTPPLSATNFGQGRQAGVPPAPAQ